MKHTILACAATLAIAACGQTELETETVAADVSADLKLYVMSCGELDGDISPFGSEGEYDGMSGELAVMCYLIRHPEGDLVWDAGLPDAVNAFTDGVPVEGTGSRMSVPVTMASQLREIGVSAEDIEYFSASHSHFDHVGNAPLLSGSTFLVHEDEYDFMYGLGVEMGLVTADLVEPLRESDTIKFREEYDVFGDGRVVIVPTPGHTPGHSVLFVDLENAGPTYLSGDLYHFARSREETIVPAFNFSKPQTLETIATFEARMAEEGARLIIQHAPEELAALPVPPAYLD
ncbi:MAG: N-acyl homoserine lactonase family protein [Pseudomonadota bacterium]